jgi:hypothetical protein
MKTTIIRPYKWSSWDCEIWVKDGKKVIIWNEQKWADFEIQGHYSLIPIEFVDDLKDVDPKGFMMNPEEETDLLYVIDGSVSMEEVSDSCETIDFGNQIDLEMEYNDKVAGFSMEESCLSIHEVLEELNYQVVSSYIIVKFQQRKLGE